MLWGLHLIYSYQQSVWVFQVAPKMTLKAKQNRKILYVLPLYDNAMLPLHNGIHLGRLLHLKIVKIKDTKTPQNPTRLYDFKVENPSFATLWVVMICPFYHFITANQ